MGSYRYVPSAEGFWDIKCPKHGDSTPFSKIQQRGSNVSLSEVETEDLSPTNDVPKDLSPRKAARGSRSSAKPVDGDASAPKIPPPARIDVNDSQKSTPLKLHEEDSGFEYVGHCVRYKKLDPATKVVKPGGYKTTPTVESQWYYAIVKFWDPKWRVLFVHHLKDDVYSNLRDDDEAARLVRDDPLDTLLSEVVVWIETTTFEVCLLNCGKVFSRPGWFGVHGNSATLSEGPISNFTRRTRNGHTSVIPSSFGRGDCCHTAVLSSVSAKSDLHSVKVDCIVDIGLKSPPITIDPLKRGFIPRKLDNVSDSGIFAEPVRKGIGGLQVTHSDDFITPTSTKLPTSHPKTLDAPITTVSMHIDDLGPTSPSMRFKKVAEEPAERVVHKCRICDREISCFVNNLFQKRSYKAYKTFDDTVDFGKLVDSLRSIMRLPNNAFTSPIHGQYSSMHDIGNLSEAEVCRLLEDNIDITRLVMNNMLEDGIPISDRFRVAICVKMIIWLRHLSGCKGMITCDSSFRVLYWGVRCSDCGEAYHARCLPYYHLTKGPPWMYPDIIMGRNRHHNTMCRLYRTFATMKPGGSPINHYRMDYSHVSKIDIADYTPTMCTEVLHDISPYISIPQRGENDMDASVERSPVPKVKAIKKKTGKATAKKGSKARADSIDDPMSKSLTGEDQPSTTVMNSQVPSENPLRPGSAGVSSQPHKDKNGADGNTDDIQIDPCTTSDNTMYSALDAVCKASTVAIIDNSNGMAGGITVLGGMDYKLTSLPNISHTTLFREDDSVVFVPYIERWECQPWKCESCTICVYCCLPTRIDHDDTTAMQDISSVDDRKKPYKHLYPESLLEKLDAMNIKPKDRRDAKFVRCVSCNVAAHKKCCNPVVNDLAFVESWRCESCLQCICCGYRDSNSPDYMNWGLFFLFCLRCWQAFEKGNYCGVCYKIWTHLDNASYRWIQCMGCKLWIHMDCDPTSREVSGSGNTKNLKYKCPACSSGNKLHRMFRVLELVFNLDRYNQFRYPVPTTYTAYWNIITWPMDLITIRNKWEIGLYHTFEEFVFDVLLTSHNAKILNMPNTKTYKIAVSFEWRCRHFMSGIFGLSESDMDLILQCGLRHAKLESLCDRIESISSGSRFDKTRVTIESADDAYNIDELSGFPCNELKQHLKFDEFDGHVRFNRQSYFYRMRCYQRLQCKRLHERLCRYNYDYLLAHLGIPDFLHNVENVHKMFPAPAVSCGLQFPVVTIVHPRKDRTFSFSIAFSPDEDLIKPILSKSLVLYDLKILNDIDTADMLYSYDSSYVDVLCSYYSDNLCKSEGLWDEFCVVCGSSAYNNYMVFCHTCGEAFHYYCAGLLFPPQFVQYSRFRCANCTVCECCNCRVVSNHIYDLSNINDFRLGNALGWLPKLIDYTGLKLSKDKHAHLMYKGEQGNSGDMLDSTENDNGYTLPIKSESGATFYGTSNHKVTYANSISGDECNDIYTPAKCYWDAHDQSISCDMKIDSVNSTSGIDTNGESTVTTVCQPPLVNVRCCFCGTTAHLKCAVGIDKKVLPIPNDEDESPGITPTHAIATKHPAMAIGEPMVLQFVPMAMPTIIPSAVPTNVPRTRPSSKLFRKTYGKANSDLGIKKNKVTSKGVNADKISTSSGHVDPDRSIPGTPNILQTAVPGAIGLTTTGDTMHYVCADGSISSVAFAVPQHAVLHPHLQGTHISHVQHAVPMQPYVQMQPHIYMAQPTSSLYHRSMRNKDGWSNLHASTGNIVNPYESQMMATTVGAFSSAQHHYGNKSAVKSTSQVEYFSGIYNNIGAHATPGSSGMLMANVAIPQSTSGGMVQMVGSIGSEVGLHPSSSVVIPTWYHQTIPGVQSGMPQTYMSASGLTSNTMCLNVMSNMNQPPMVSGTPGNWLHGQNISLAITQQPQVIPLKNESSQVVPGSEIVYVAPGATNYVLNGASATSAGHMRHIGVVVPGAYPPNTVVPSPMSVVNPMDRCLVGDKSAMLSVQRVHTGVSAPLVASALGFPSPQSMGNRALDSGSNSSSANILVGVNSMDMTSNSVGIKSESGIPGSDTPAAKTPNAENSSMQPAGLVTINSDENATSKRETQVTFDCNNSQSSSFEETPKSVGFDSKAVWQHDGSGTFSCNHHLLSGFDHLYTSFAYPHQSLFKISRLPQNDLLLKNILDTVGMGSGVKDEIASLEGMDVSHMQGCSYTRVRYKTVYNAKCVCCGVPIQANSKPMDISTFPDSSSLVLEQMNLILLPSHMGCYEMCQDCKLWRVAFIKDSPDYRSFMQLQGTVPKPFNETDEISASPKVITMLTSNEFIKALSMIRHWNLLSENVLKYLRVIVMQWVHNRGGDFSCIEYNPDAFTELMSHIYHSPRFTTFDMRSCIYSGLVSSPLSPISFTFWADSLRNCNPHDEQIEDIFNMISKEYHPSPANANDVPPSTNLNASSEDALTQEDSPSYPQKRPNEDTTRDMTTMSNKSLCKNGTLISQTDCSNAASPNSIHPTALQHVEVSPEGLSTEHPQCEPLGTPNPAKSDSVPLTTSTSDPSHTNRSIHEDITRTLDTSDHMHSDAQLGCVLDDTYCTPRKVSSLENGSHGCLDSAEQHPFDGSFSGITRPPGYPISGKTASATDDGGIERLSTSPLIRSPRLHSKSVEYGYDESTRTPDVYRPYKDTAPLSNRDLASSNRTGETSCDSFNSGYMSTPQHFGHNVSSSQLSSSSSPCGISSSGYQLHELPQVFGDFVSSYVSMIDKTSHLSVEHDRLVNLRTQCSTAIDKQSSTKFLDSCVSSDSPFRQLCLKWSKLLDYILRGSQQNDYDGDSTEYPYIRRHLAHMIFSEMDHYMGDYRRAWELCGLGIIPPSYPRPNTSNYAMQCLSFEAMSIIMFLRQLDEYLCDNDVDVLVTNCVHPPTGKAVPRNSFNKMYYLNQYVALVNNTLADSVLFSSGGSSTSMRSRKKTPILLHSSMDTGENLATKDTHLNSLFRLVDGIKTHLDSIFTEEGLAILDIESTEYSLRLGNSLIVEAVSSRAICGDIDVDSFILRMDKPHTCGSTDCVSTMNFDECFDDFEKNDHLPMNARKLHITQKMLPRRVLVLDDPKTMRHSLWSNPHKRCCLCAVSYNTVLRGNLLPWRDGYVHSECLLWSVDNAYLPRIYNQNYDTLLLSSCVLKQDIFGITSRDISRHMTYRRTRTTTNAEKAALMEDEESNALYPQLFNLSLLDMRVLPPVTLPDKLVDDVVTTSYDAYCLWCGEVGASIHCTGLKCYAQFHLVCAFLAANSEVSTALLNTRLENKAQGPTRDIFPLRIYYTRRLLWCASCFRNQVSNKIDRLAFNHLIKLNPRQMKVFLALEGLSSSATLITSKHVLQSVRIIPKTISFSNVDEYIEGMESEYTVLYSEFKQRLSVMKEGETLRRLLDSIRKPVITSPCFSSSLHEDDKKESAHSCKCHRVVSPKEQYYFNFGWTSSSISPFSRMRTPQRINSSSEGTIEGHNTVGGSINYTSRVTLSLKERRRLLRSKIQLDRPSCVHRKKSTVCNHPKVENANGDCSGNNEDPPDACVSNLGYLKLTSRSRTVSLSSISSMMALRRAHIKLVLKKKKKYHRRLTSHMSCSSVSLRSIASGNVTYLSNLDSIQLGSTSVKDSGGDDTSTHGSLSSNELDHVTESGKVGAASEPEMVATEEVKDRTTIERPLTVKEDDMKVNELLSQGNDVTMNKLLSTSSSSSSSSYPLNNNVCGGNNDGGGMNTDGRETENKFVSSSTNMNNTVGIVRTGSLTILDMGSGIIFDYDKKAFPVGFTSVRIFWAKGDQTRGKLCASIKGVAHNGIPSVLNGSEMRRSYLCTIRIRQSQPYFSISLFAPKNRDITERIAISQGFNIEEVFLMFLKHLGRDRSHRFTAVDFFGLNHHYVVQELRMRLSMCVLNRTSEFLSVRFFSAAISGKQFSRRGSTLKPMTCYGDSTTLPPGEDQERLRKTKLRSVIDFTGTYPQKLNGDGTPVDHSWERHEFDFGTPSSQYRYLSSIPPEKRLEVRNSRIHGFGLFVTEDVAAGEPVVEYIGELIREHIGDRREETYSKEQGGDGSCYMFRLDEELIVDATRKGSMSRFINHSCEPNCMCRIVTCDKGLKHIVVFAKVDLKAGEEVTYDYKFGVEGESQKLVCLCGSTSCMGRMN